MPADRWMAIITMTAVILMAVGLRGFFGRIAIFLGLIFGYVLSWTLRRDPAGRWRRRRRPRQLGQRQGRRLVRPAAAHRRRAGRQPVALRRRQHCRGRLARAQLLADLHAAGAPGRDRPDRGEHRPRQGRVRDDRSRPRPGHGPGHRRRRHRHRDRHVRRRFADHDVRREHRRHGGDPGLLDRGLLRGRDRRHPARPRPQVRRRSSRRRPVAVLGGHHARALRHDRPARRQDLGREPGRTSPTRSTSSRWPPA